MSKEEGGRKKEKERASEGGGNIGEKRRDGNYFFGNAVN